MPLHKIQNFGGNSNYLNTEVKIFKIGNTYKKCSPLFHLGLGYDIKLFLITPPAILTQFYCTFLALLQKLNTQIQILVFHSKLALLTHLLIPFVYIKTGGSFCNILGWNGFVSM